MQQGQFTSVNWSNSNFAGYISEDNICLFTGEQIGVTLAKYTQVAEALQKCKNRLIELGEIKVPKTQEQIIQEQSNLLEKQSQVITKLLEKIDEFRPNNVIPSATMEGQSENSNTDSIAESRSDDNKDKKRCSKSDTKSSHTK